MKYFNYKNEACSQAYYEQFRDEWLEKGQKLVDEHMRNFSWGENLTVCKGRRYDKIICSTTAGMGSSPSTRVWAFVDKTNGDILKPESWKKPAKHARGNIYDENPMLFVTYSGPAYMDKVREYYGA